MSRNTFINELNFGGGGKKQVSDLHKTSSMNIGQVINMMVLSSHEGMLFT